MERGRHGVVRSRGLAYLLSIHLAPIQLGELRVGASRVPSEPWSAGTITLANLHDEPRASRVSDLDALIGYLPRAAFDDLALEHDARPCVPWGTPDPIAMHLGACLLRMLAAPSDGSSLFVDQLVLTLLTRLTQHYGGFPFPAGPRAGSLAPFE